MPLVKCPDCEKEISDRAAACIHCGCPMTQENALATTSISNTPQVIPVGGAIMCPSCNSTSGARSLRAILESDTSYINTNTVTSGQMFDANATRNDTFTNIEMGSQTFGEQRSVLATELLDTINSWTTRNSDRDKLEEMLDVFKCSSCAAYFHKGKVQTLEQIAERIFIGKSLHGKFGGDFCRIYLPGDEIDRVVRHTVLQYKPKKRGHGSFKEPIIGKVTKPRPTQGEQGLTIWWYPEKENPPGTIWGIKKKEKIDKANAEALNQGLEPSINLKKVIIRTDHGSTSGVRISYESGKSFMCHDMLQDDFLRWFRERLCKNLDKYAVLLKKGANENEIRNAFP